MDGQKIKDALGQNIKNLRSNRRYSQAQLAEAADISIIYLSNIERGKKFPKPAILSQLAESLDVEVFELFKPNSPQKPAPITKNDDKKKLLTRLSKVMTVKVNNAVTSTMEKVFTDFMK